LDIEFAKKDWLSLDANRYFVPNSFDFTIETIGVYRNVDLVKMACDIMMNKINTFKENLNKNPELITPLINKTTIPQAFEIILENEDYTLGKVIEYMLYKNYYEESKILSFCGFRKPHPHIPISIIRIAYHPDFKNDGDDSIEALKSFTLQILNECCDSSREIYASIKRVF